MNKLSRREKFLIYFLVCFLVTIFGTFYVIKPSYEKFVLVNQQAVEAKFTQQSMEMTIDGIPASMQARDEAKAKLAGLKTPFPANLPNEGIDSLLTQLCLGYSLSPKLLAIENNQFQDVTVFTEYTNKGASGSVAGADANPGSTDASSGSAGTTSGSTDAASATTAANSGAADETANTATPPSGDNAVSAGVQTWSSVVNMQLTGTQANFYRLIDGVNARPDMIISNFYIEPLVSSEAVTSTSGSSITNVVYSGYKPKLDGGNVIIDVTFVVYMVEK